jgi:hypothetical protein
MKERKLERAAHVSQVSESSFSASNGLLLLLE